MSMLSRGSSLTTDRLILTPEDAGAHYFQIVSTDEELRFQRFVATGKPSMDANQRFVGDRGDDANVETFMVLSDPFAANIATLIGEPSLAQQTVRITKPVKCLDDLTIRGLLSAPAGIAFTGNAFIDANARIVGSPEVYIAGDVRSDANVRILGGTLTLGNVHIVDDHANAALSVDANLHITGDQLTLGATQNTGLRSDAGTLKLIAGDSERISMSDMHVAIACGAGNVGTANEIRFQKTPDGNAQLVFYNAVADEPYVTLEASVRGLVVTVHGENQTSQSFYSSFSGLHLCMGEGAGMYDYELVGQVVESTGNHNNVGGVPINPVDAVPTVRIAREGSKAVFGVIAHIEPPYTTERTLVGGALSIVGIRPVNDRRLMIASVGEGAMFVLSENGAIENGDYIEVSSVPGYGRRSNSEVLTNKIVAKATGPCNFGGTNERVNVYVDMLGDDGNVIIDSAGVPVRVPLLDTDGLPVTRPRYFTKRVGAWIAAYIGVTFHCG